MRDCGPMGSTNAIQGTHLTVRYGRRLALDDVSFAVVAGSATALVGANASGKSTLLHAMAGLIDPSSGSIERASPKVAYVLQHTGMRSWMPLTVDEVLHMGRYGAVGRVGRFGRDDRVAISEAAARLEVENIRRRQFGELSGGQRQRVLVAQALTQQAPVLLLDEPITGLDLPSQDRILDVVEEETQAGRTVVMSTHHLEEAHHCEQVLVLATRLVAAGAPTEVLTPDVLRAAYEDHLFGAHAGHDHPTGLMLFDDHGHGHDPTSQD